MTIPARLFTCPRCLADGSATAGGLCAGGARPPPAGGQRSSAFLSCWRACRSRMTSPRRRAWARRTSRRCAPAPRRTRRPVRAVRRRPCAGFSPAHTLEPRASGPAGFAGELPAQAHGSDCAGVPARARGDLPAAQLRAGRAAGAVRGRMAGRGGLRCTVWGPDGVAARRQRAAAGRPAGPAGARVAGRRPAGGAPGLAGACSALAAPGSGFHGPARRQPGAGAAPRGSTAASCQRCTVGRPGACRRQHRRLRGLRGLQAHDTSLGVVIDSKSDPLRCRN